MAATTSENDDVIIHFNLMSLPREILDKIFSFLTYDETSSSRMVSKVFDMICRERLNTGLARVDRFHSQIHREMKGKLPRRESERRNHVLARHIDILSAIETRLSLLSMTYSKYIEMGLCCFIPGKVLDEMLHVLREVKGIPNPPRTHELLQELRDISSMAMEHFDEKIVPLLKQEKKTTPRFAFSDQESYAGLPMLTCSAKSQKSLAKVSSSISELNKKLLTSQQRISHQNNRMKDMERKLMEQIAHSLEREKHFVDQDRRITEIELKLKEYNQTFVDSTALHVRSASVDGSSSTKDGNDDEEAGSSKAEIAGGLPSTCNVVGGDATEKRRPESDDILPARKKPTGGRGRKVVVVESEPEKKSESTSSVEVADERKNGATTSDVGQRPKRNAKKAAIDRRKETTQKELVPRTRPKRQSRAELNKGEEVQLEVEEGGDTVPVRGRKRNREEDKIDDSPPKRHVRRSQREKI